MTVGLEALRAPCRAAAPECALHSSGTTFRDHLPGPPQPSVGIILTPLRRWWDNHPPFNAWETWHSTH